MALTRSCTRQRFPAIGTTRAGAASACVANWPPSLPSIHQRGRPSGGGTPRAGSLHREDWELRVEHTWTFWGASGSGVREISLLQGNVSVQRTNAVAEFRVKTSCLNRRGRRRHCRVSNVNRSGFLPRFVTGHPFQTDHGERRGPLYWTAPNSNVWST